MILDSIDIETMEAHRVAPSVIDTLQHNRRKTAPRKTPGITAREALRALRFEAFLVSVAACNLAHGFTLSEEDRDRLLTAWTRIDTIIEDALP